MDRIDLEESTGIVPVADLRRRMDEPPPVRLIAIDDVKLLTLPGKFAELDRFYLDLWQFDRESSAGQLVYRAENFRIRFQVITGQRPIERDGVRPLGIEVRSLRDAELKLANARIDYTRERGLLPGQISLLTQDPAGNWIELFESVLIA
jgi:hypothetical protein